jgi:hypothetical protein
MQISISDSALDFMRQRDIQDVTFDHKIITPTGCCVGIVKEIEPTYRAVKNASNYRYFKAEGKHVFVSRHIKIVGPLTLTTEGFWKIKRLALDGVTIPI